MSYETLIGFRYLYRGKPGLVAVVGLLASLLVMGGGAALFLATGHPSPVGVFLLFIGSLAASVFGLLCLFSVFTTVSVIGVVLGVAALIVIMSVTSGFQAAFQDKVLGVNAHVLVMKNSTDFRNYADVEKKAAANPEVIAVQPFVFVEMLITRGKGELSGIAMKGVDPDQLSKVLDLPKHMIAGSIDVLNPKADEETGPDWHPPIIIGRELARKLKLLDKDDNPKLGEVVTLVLPNLSGGDLEHWKPSTRPPKTRKFTLRGVFYSGFDEYDRRLVYVNIKDAQDFLGEGDVVMGVEMKLKHVDRASDVARSLEKKLGPEYVVMDWRELNNNLFTALVLQKLILILILVIIIVVAAFNMVSSLTMMVTDKTKEIAILKSMGAPALGSAGIFQVVGVTIGLAGTAIGIGLGLLWAGAMARYGYPLDPKVYLIDRLPIHVIPREVIYVGIITMIISFLATLYPALKASFLRPVEGLRYE